MPHSKCKRKAAAALAGVGTVLALLTGTAHADLPEPPKKQDTEDIDQAQALEKQHADDNLETWLKIAEVFCNIDGKAALSPNGDPAAAEQQFSDAGIREWYEKWFSLSPLVFVDDPWRLAMTELLTNESGRAPASGKYEDRLRQLRHLTCEAADFKEDWEAALKTFTERYGVRMKPGMTEEKAILDLYDKKMRGEIALLIKEQKRQDIEPDPDLEAILEGSSGS
ncbi:hypothetical protein [Nocardia transvalensis]|uniref:hypothetical protein n=1 Tax=Nocardia transvalensis TaxID=37333 RepID=UPI0018931223|nr:hypothetical protein [Nocardia transvalensis]MBF6329857.1 hypothetical protein [Nocardia transvalensis]